MHVLCAMPQSLSGRKTHHKSRTRTDDDDVVVELILVLGSDALTFAVHLGHLLERVEDGRDDALVIRVDNLSHVELTRVFELVFDPVHKVLEFVE